MKIGAYLDQVRAKYESGHATEHSYRPALQVLFESIDPALGVINEPKKTEAGMPDFLFQRGKSRSARLRLGAALSNLSGRISDTPG